MSKFKVDRREFVRRGVQASLGVGVLAESNTSNAISDGLDAATDFVGTGTSSSGFSGVYEGAYRDQIAFPLGGLGAGMICLEGSGALSRFSLRHRLEADADHQVFAAISVRGENTLALVLEGPVPNWKLRPQFPDQGDVNNWGLPRFHSATFRSQFPFGVVSIDDGESPLGVLLTGWSPFYPGDEDNSSLPVAGMEYRLTNRSERTIEAVFSYNAENFLSNQRVELGSPATDRLDRIYAIRNGFVLHTPGTLDRPWDKGSCAFWVDAADTSVDYAWPCDSLNLLWQKFSAGQYDVHDPLQDRAAAGASLFVPLRLAPGEIRTVIVYVAWYVPDSDLFQPRKGYKAGHTVTYPSSAEKYKPWYAKRFSGISDVIGYWSSNYHQLRDRASLFARALEDSTLPPEVMSAVSSNLAILKSTTILRQHDGRLWGWEGSYKADPEVDLTGISGTSTHVWNYAQTIPHLFPALERGLRETEFGNNQNAEGLQYCRTPLPIRSVEPGHASPDGSAADGQLGGIIKVHREWRICGDIEWLRQLWPKVRASLDYCVRTWDPQQRGLLEEPHVTTYDMEFWGADSLCTSLYIGALQAAVSIGKALNEPVGRYSYLLDQAIKQMEVHLFNGEYFIQRTKWKGLQSSFSPYDSAWFEMYGNSVEWQALLQREGPSGQYGTGCLSDGVIGLWLCGVSGIETTVDKQKVKDHLLAVYRYNFKQAVTANMTLLRAPFACNNESGLLLCTWPKGGRPSMAMMYSGEVWSGVEYQVASHLIMSGRVDEGLEIVRATRRRYDGLVRNPFDEVEAGHWYARAMSSYSLLQACSGARFDAVDKTLYLHPAIKGDFRCFLATESGFGTVGVKDGRPFVEVVSGRIPYQQIHYVSA